MKNIKTSSLLLLIAIYIVILFFPTSSNDDTWTYFKIVRGAIINPGTGIDLVVALLMLLPAAALIATTYFFVKPIKLKALQEELKQNRKLT